MSDSNPFYGSTFAERQALRGGGGRKVEPKQVDEDSEQVEDKAVKASEARRTTRKKS